MQSTDHNTSIRCALKGYRGYALTSDLGPDSLSRIPLLPLVTADRPEEEPRRECRHGHWSLHEGVHCRSQLLPTLWQVDSLERIYSAPHVPCPSDLPRFHTHDSARRSPRICFGRLVEILHLLYGEGGGPEVNMTSQMGTARNNIGLLSTGRPNDESILSALCGLYWRSAPLP